MNYKNINNLLDLIKEPNISKKNFAEIKESKITYQKLLSDVKKLHVLYSDGGLKKGDKVILSVSDDYYTSLFFISLLSYGAVTVFIDPEIPLLRASGIINKSDATSFIMNENLFDSWEIDSAKLKFELKVSKKEQKKASLFSKLLKNKTENDTKNQATFPDVLDKIEPRDISLENINDDDLAYIIFTSGTTSNPKGVMISHQNLFSHLETLSKVYRCSNQDRFHNILMLYHADGVIQGPLLALYNQSTWVNPLDFDINEMNKLFNSIYQNKVTHFITVPTIISLMHKFHEDYEDSFQFDDFKFVISVASKLEHNLWQEFEETFKVKITNVYGLTETVAGSIFNSVFDENRKIDSIGFPVDCEVKLTVDSDDMTASDKGNLWLKGSHIFKGYINEAEATKAIFKDGWLDTGDIATKNENGQYNIIGRSKNVINSGGINIYPEQITEMINLHQQVLESVTIGIEDENFGQKLVSVVVLKSKTDNLKKSELIEFIKPLLEKNQIPKEIYFFDELPKGLSGKIKLNEIKDLINSLKEDVSDTKDNSISEVILKSAADAFRIDIEKIKMNDNSNTIDGWDSMGHLMFITNMENHLKIQFSTAEMMRINGLKVAEQIIMQKKLK